MATLDRIMEMQKSGVSDAEITTRLTNEGVPPADINNSFNQAKVKNAVSPPEGVSAGAGEMQASIMGDAVNVSPTAEGLGTSPAPVAPMAAPVPQAPEQSIQPEQMLPMQDAGASMGRSPPMQEAPLNGGAPVPQAPMDAGPPMQQDPGMQMPPAPMDAGPEVYPAEAPMDPYYDQNQYPEQEYYPPADGMNTDTISEIAEQVATEKINEYKQKTGDILNFKNTIQAKVNDMDDRLKRIENSIDKLQHAIIGKVGEMGENSAMIHKDLDNLHGTVRKLMDPLVDNINELRKMSK